MVWQAGLAALPGIAGAVGGFFDDGGDSSQELLAQLSEQSTARQFRILGDIQRYLLHGDPGFLQGLDLEALGFEGTVTPEAGRLLEQVFAGTEAYGQGQAGQARQGALARLLAGESAFEPDPALRERFFNESVVAPTLRAFNEQVVPAITSRLVAGGGAANLGPLAGQLLGRAGRDVTADLGGILAGLVRDDERLAAQSRENALGRLLPAVSLSAEEELRPLSLGAQVGTLERGIRGEFNNEALQRLLLAQPFSDPRLGLLGAAFANPYGLVGQQQTGTTSAGNAGGLLGILASPPGQAGLGALASIFGGGGGALF